MSHGLSEKTIGQLHSVLAKHPEVERAVLYGSRAKGNYKPGSDIDLTLFGEGLTCSTMTRVAGEMDELPTPYMVDLSIYDQLNNDDLKAHIDRVGMVIYEREKHGIPAEKLAAY